LGGIFATVIIAIVLLLAAVFSFGLGNKPYPLNCGKYLGIAIKLIVRSTTGTLK